MDNTSLESTRFFMSMSLSEVKAMVGYDFHSPASDAHNMCAVFAVIAANDANEKQSIAVQLSDGIQRFSSRRSGPRKGRFWSENVEPSKSGFTVCLTILSCSKQFCRMGYTTQKIISHS